MILQALHALAEAERLVGDPDYEWKAVPWLIRVDADGRLLGIEDTRTTPPAEEGSRRKPRPVAKRFLVPRQAPSRSGKKPPAEFLVDNASFVFGADFDDKGTDEEELRRRAAAFRAKLERCAQETEDRGMRAILCFLEDFATGHQPINRPDRYEKGDRFTFVFDPDVDLLACQRSAAREWWKEQRNKRSGPENAYCLVTGQPCTPTTKHPKLKNVPQSGGQGEIAFATSVVTLDQAYCATLGHDIAPDAYLRLSVSDTGAGMDRKTLDRIFEPFFTTKEPGKGTGMGLAAVYGTVRSVGGAVTVYSEPGRGSSFHLYFPLLATDTAAAPAKEPPAAETWQGHVLLVDDEPAVAASIEKLLRRQGLTVTAFHNGTDALAFYRQRWQSVDVVILDMVMPPPGGKETFAALKQVNPDVAVLLASGYSLNGEAQSILDMGARGFIQKPLVLSDLLERLRAAMRRSR